jgi:hypothetical protein
MRPLSPTFRLAAAGALVALVAALIAVLMARPFSSSGPSSPGLHVAASGAALPQLRDDQGRAVLLRGVAVTGLVRYAPGYAENPPIQDADFAELAALGFDFVRLPVSWSAIEPSPGVIDTRYVDEIATVVHEAENHGLRVLVDMHMDRYNARLAPGNEADGAPDWATRVPSTCPAQPSPDDCARAAWQSFWSGQQIAGTSLQEHYLHALEAVSRRLRADHSVAGFELMNNPSSGGDPSPQFETDQLWPFYRRTIAALRADGEGRPLWIDRAASSEQRDGETPGVPTSLSADPNLVLAPHDYVGVFSKPDWPAGGQERLSGFYADAAHQAATLHAALVIGEWGAQAGAQWDDLLRTKLGLQDGLGVGSSFWMWKQRPGFYNWHLVNLDGSLRGDTMRAQIVSEPYPQAVPGRVVSDQVANGRATVVINADRPGTALLWSGTRVVAGGPSGLNAPLIHASLDGHAVPVTLSARSFHTPAVALTGDVVAVQVPAGRHSLELN